MDKHSKQQKDGVSVKELEIFAKKYRFEVFLCLFFLLAGIFGCILWHPGWSVLLVGAGGIIGSLIPQKIGQISRKLLGFVFRQDRNTQIIIAAIALILAIFVPPLVYLLFGLHAGKSMHVHAQEVHTEK